MSEHFLENKNKKGEWTISRKGKSNGFPEIPDRYRTSKIPGLPSAEMQAYVAKSSLFSNNHTNRMSTQVT